MKNIKVGIDTFNDLAKSHDAHVKEVERLQKELDELNKLKLVDQNGELLLECRVGDKYHQLLLEVGLNTILEKFIKIKEGKMSHDEFFSEMRRQGVEHLGQVRIGLLEVDGNFSLVLYPLDDTRYGLPL